MVYFRRNLFLLYVPWSLNINHYPILKEHLLNFKEPLSKRPEVKNKRYKWYCLSRYNSENPEFFESPKLIYPSLSKTISIVYDENSYFILNSAFMINDINNDKNYLKALSTILSSNLFEFYMKLITDNLQGDHYSLKKIYIENLPIVSLSEEDKIILSELANKMLDLNKQVANCKTPNEKRLIEKQIEVTDKKINQLVYELYEITDEEIEIVENSLMN